MREAFDRRLVHDSAEHRQDARKELLDQRAGSKWSRPGIGDSIPSVAPPRERQQLLSVPPRRLRAASRGSDRGALGRRPRAAASPLAVDRVTHQPQDREGVQLFRSRVEARAKSRRPESNFIHPGLALPPALVNVGGDPQRRMGYACGRVDRPDEQKQHDVHGCQGFVRGVVVLGPVEGNMKFVSHLHGSLGTLQDRLREEYESFLAAAVRVLEASGEPPPSGGVAAPSFRPRRRALCSSCACHARSDCGTSRKCLATASTSQRPRARCRGRRPSRRPRCPSASRAGKRAP